MLGSGATEKALDGSQTDCVVPGQTNELILAIPQARPMLYQYVSRARSYTNNLLAWRLFDIKHGSTQSLALCLSVGGLPLLPLSACRKFLGLPSNDMVL